MHPHNAFYIQDLLANALNLLALVIFIQVIVNWLVYMGKMSAYHPVAKTLHQVVTPVLAPVRRVIPPSMTGGWDISPMIVIFFLQFLSRQLQSG